MLFAYLSNYAQNNLVKVPVAKGDPYNYAQHLPDIKNSGYKYYIRYHTLSQITDLYSNDSINFNGQLLNHIKEVDTKTSEGRNYVYQITHLDADACSKVGYKILKDKLPAIPTDTLITGYNNELNDCAGVNFIFKINETFIKTSYGCPWYQDTSIPQLKLLDENYIYIDSVLKLEEGYNTFTSKLEKGKYYSMGFTGMYIKTDSEMRAWEKLKNENRYLYSVKDTISNYLRAELNKIHNNKDYITCFDYNLVFSKKGKLIKTVKFHEPDETFLVRLFDKDYQNCKKKIKRLFKNISLKHLHLKYGFARQISFYEGNFTLSDPTAY